MKREIRSSITEIQGLREVYGFGSFFRGEKFNDIDILGVAENNPKILVSCYYQLRNCLRPVEIAYRVEIDLTLLMLSEFLAEPLRDMRDIVLIKR